MADTKVSDLNSITVVDNNDVLYIVDTSSSASKKITYGNLLSGVNSNITTLTNDVNTYTTAVLEFSAVFEEANLDIGPLQADVLQLSTNVALISAELDSRPEGVTGSFVIETSTFEFIEGQLITVTS